MPNKNLDARSQSHPVRKVKKSSHHIFIPVTVSTTTLIFIKHYSKYPLIAPVPGGVKSLNPFGQLPRLPGSPPIRTHDAVLGMPLSSTKSWNHPAGATFTFGGAVIVHVPPEQDTAGMMVRWPMELPCVEDTAPNKVTEIVPPLGFLTFVI